MGGTACGWLDGDVLETTPPAPPVLLAPRRHGPRVTLWLLRLALALTATAAVAQPVLIGGYLDGAFDLIGVHGANGSVLLTLTMLAGLAAVLYAWPGGGRPWPLLAVVVLWWAEAVQLAMGYARVLSVHVPLGVLVVASAAALAVWCWTPAARLPRRGWWR
jgi:hypothetical protein